MDRQDTICSSCWCAAVIWGTCCRPRTLLKTIKQHGQNIQMVQGLLVNVKHFVLIVLLQHKHSVFYTFYTRYYTFVIVVPLKI